MGLFYVLLPFLIMSIMSISCSKKSRYTYTKPNSDYTRSNSPPINNNSTTAKEIIIDMAANKDYCSPKPLWYHGLKIHSLNVLIPQSLPLTTHIVMSAASKSDMTVFKDQIAPTLYNMRVFADKIYNDDELEHRLLTNQNVHFLPM